MFLGKFRDSALPNRHSAIAGRDPDRSSALTQCRLDASSQLSLDRNGEVDIHPTIDRNGRNLDWLYR